MEKLVEAIFAKPDSNPTSPEDGGFPDCSVFMNSFSKCLGMGHQQDYLYRHGTYEDCSLNFDDWKACMHSRLIHDGEKKKEMYKATYHLQKIQLRNSNDIFVYKEKPGWNN
eukprot:gene30633-37012_t